MAKSRVFYLLTLRSNAKKKDLKKFLEKEWLPALRRAPGCLEVEVLESYQDRAGYCISELWESREIHLKSTAKLWQEEGKELMQKIGKYAIFETLWNCTILDV